jgi:hypothetical protein
VYEVLARAAYILWFNLALSQMKNADIMLIKSAPKRKKARREWRAVFNKILWLL